MRSFLLTLVVFFVAPSAASASVTMVVRDVPLKSARSLSAARATEFDMVGLHWQGSGSVEFRTRSTSGRWGRWQPAAPEEEDRPDVGSAESRGAGSWRLGSPYWTGPSDRIAYRLHGRVLGLRAYFIQSPVERIPLRRLSLAGVPPIIPRLSWGANEAIRRAAPSYAQTLGLALVHHTAGSNSYGPAESAAIVRGIQTYHVKGNGWNDIGYNFLVDRYGQIFEGRYGGIDRNVVGAHAEGFNTGSVGVSVLGTYGSSAPPVAARTALARLLAWRLDLAHVDPLSSLTWSSGGNPRFPFGTPVFLHAVAGHRDTGFTSCPGNAFYAQLGTLARQISGLGLPKLYSPTVEGGLGGQVRFRARLSESLPWTVTVSGTGGQLVASGAGTSQDVDWTWDAATAVPGSYSWTIAAGDTVRPATGTIGATPVALAIRSTSASPSAISPDGDGQADSSTIGYTLTAPATVTATLRPKGGSPLAMLFSEPKSPGKQSFVFSPAGIADGSYEIVLSASDGKATVSVVVPVLLDRTVRRFAAVPPWASPNGDGVLDELTFKLDLALAAGVRIDIAQGASAIASAYSADLGPGEQTIGWKPEGVRDGRYSAVLTTTNELGSVRRSAAIRVDTVRPTLRAISFRRLVFRVSEPATVTLTVNGKRIRRSVRAGAFSFRISRVRTVRIVVQDPAGNLSRTLRYP